VTASPRPRVLYACPNSLLDGSNGAALSMRTLLGALAARGIAATALQATIFDAPAAAAPVLEAAAAHQDKRLVRTFAHGVEHILVRTASTARPQMTSEEQEVFLRAFREEIAARPPGAVILWGAMLLEMTIAREAREADIPVVFYLVNDGYREAATFRDAAVIVTDSRATALLYQARLGLECVNVGNFIDETAVVAPERRPEYVTFVNPSFEKGVNVFMPLARLARAELPEAKFLVVQSRGRWSEALDILGYTPADFPNVKVLGHHPGLHARRFPEREGARSSARHARRLCRHQGAAGAFPLARKRRARDHGSAPERHPGAGERDGRFAGAGRRRRRDLRAAAGSDRPSRAARAGRGGAALGG
jgi:hypothetical protein